MAFSNGPKGIITDGLVFAADAGNKQCFTSGESTCKDLIQGSTGTLEGNTTFSSEAGGSWEFDGTSDDITWGTTVPIVEDFDTTSTFTFMQWHNQDATGEYHGLMTRSGTSYKGISQSVDNDNKFYVQLINALNSRIKVYSRETQEVVQYYRTRDKLKTVLGSISIDEVKHEIINAIKSLENKKYGINRGSM